MIDNLLTFKAAIIGRSVKRACQEYRREPVSLATDLSRQNTAIPNILSAFEAELHMGQHLFWHERLGVPHAPHRRLHRGVSSLTPHLHRVPTPATRRTVLLPRHPVPIIHIITKEPTKHLHRIKYLLTNKIQPNDIHHYQLI